MAAVGAHGADGAADGARGARRARLAIAHALRSRREEPRPRQGPVSTTHARSACAVARAAIGAALAREIELGAGGAEVAVLAQAPSLVAHAVPRALRGARLLRCREGIARAPRPARIALARPPLIERGGGGAGGAGGGFGGGGVAPGAAAHAAPVAAAVGRALGLHLLARHAAKSGRAHARAARAEPARGALREGCEERGEGRGERRGGAQRRRARVRSRAHAHWMGSRGCAARCSRTPSPRSRGRTGTRRPRTRRGQSRRPGTHAVVRGCSRSPSSPQGTRNRPGRCTCRARSSLAGTTVRRPCCSRCPCSRGRRSSPTLGSGRDRCSAPCTPIGSRRRPPWRAPAGLGRASWWISA